MPSLKDLLLLRDEVEQLRKRVEEVVNAKPNPVYDSEYASLLTAKQDLLAFLAENETKP